MFIFMGLIVVGSCFCMFCAYHVWENARMYNAQAENYLRMANEKLYDVDKIAQKINASKQQSGGAKVLPFKRHLSVVPPENDKPNDAA